jgi:peptidyl-dipeptidase Dcp
MRALSLLAATALCSGCATLSPNTSESTMAANNPLLGASDLPYQLPDFAALDDAHFGPALRAGMQQHKAEVAAIVNSPEAPSFDNTLVALERSGRILDRAARVFYALNAADTNDARQALEAEIGPELAAHQDAILLNSALFGRIKAVYEQRGELDLDPESAWLLDRTYRDFVNAGAELNEADKQALKNLNQRLSELTTQFSQQLRTDTNASAIVVDDPSDLAGLADDEIAALAKAAEAAGEPGKFLISLILPTNQPSLARLQSRDLRRRIYLASIQRGNNANEHNNKATVLELARLRAERAELLGYPSHAAVQLVEQTAGTTQAVDGLMARIVPAAVRNAKREAAALQTLIDAEGGNFKLMPWDWSYYAEKLRAQEYAFDEAQLKPYFELNRVLVDGVFEMAERLYGLRFERRDDLQGYHPDVTVYEVIDRDDSGLGLFLFDPYARPSKRGGAWMNSHVSQSHLLGTQPVVGNHLNIPKPPQGEPALLTYDEVSTLFHEFGHAVHGLLSDVTYPRFSGTSVPRDFVEFPSQVHEMWVTWPEILKNYARHYETDEPLDPALVERLLAAQSFNEGYRSTESLAAALLDLAWHKLSLEEAQAVTDVLAFEGDALAQAGAQMTEILPRYRSTYFAHIFAGGYSAGYYSYIWSEQLDADTVEWFKENGGLTRANGDHFRATLLSRGGSKDAMQLFHDFRGRDVRIEPLLKRRGFE